MAGMACDFSVSVDGPFVVIEWEGGEGTFSFLVHNLCSIGCEMGKAYVCLVADAEKPSFRTTPMIEGESQKLVTAIRRAALEAGMWRRG